MKKVGFVSLGCPKNLVDSEVMMGQLAEAGYEITNDAAEADTVVVNTCGFIESAKQESIDTILEATRWKSEGKASRVIVAGCLVERYRDDLMKELPEVDAFIGTSQVGDILKAADEDFDAKELVLIAQDSSRYGEDLGEVDALAALIRALDEIDDIEWVRVMYAYPTHISDAFLAAIAETPKAVKYLDMPLQHASRNVLKLM